MRDIESTFSSEGAKCPQCGSVAVDDDGWITRNGESDVSFECDECGVSLIVNASFSIDYTTRIAEE